MNSLDLEVLRDINRKLEAIEQKLDSRAPEPAPMMSEAEAAELLGLRKQTLALWRSQGRGPKFVKIGGAVRYRPADLDEFIQREGVTS